MTVLVLGELRDVTLCSAISPSWTVLVVGTGLMGRGTHQVSPVYCTVSCSEGPGAPIWNYGHLSVIISCFYEVFHACLAEMVSYSILRAAVLQAAQAASSAAASFSLWFYNSIHTWIFCVLQ